MNCEVIVIGGGAAGLYCAMEAGRRGRRTVLLEHNPRLGRKILISGGGRCNFTNRFAGPDAYLSDNPRFCHSALARYAPDDFTALVDKHRIAWYEKKLGQLFCRDSAQQIVDMLESECRAAGVEIRLGARVKAVEKPGRFRVELDSETLECDALVIATGGPSVPKVGASGFAYRVAERFGLKLTDIRPGLVPLHFFPEDAHWTELRGVSLDAFVSCGGGGFRENILFSHRGLSGPAILQISSYWREGDTLFIDLLPGRSAADWLEKHAGGRMQLRNLLARHWPTRFAKAWCGAMDWDRPLNQFAPGELRAIAEAAHNWRIPMKDSAGYAKAEVTLGGVDTRELSSKTMECRRVPGLYFIGEAVDVTGHLGGYNFQWAWASGHAAGIAAGGA